MFGAIERLVESGIARSRPRSGSMSRRPIVLLAFVGLVAIGLSVLLRPSFEPRPLDPDLLGARARIARLEEEIAALRNEVDRLRPLAASAAFAERTTDPLAPHPSTATAPEGAAAATSAEVRDGRLEQEAADWLSRTLPDFLQGLSADEARFLLTLDLSDKKIAKEDLALLAGLEHLVVLDLGNNGSDDALKSLANLDRLRHLDLGGASVTLAGLQWLPTQSLRSLHVQDTPLTDLDVDAFRRLDHLEKLKLDRTKVTDASMATLGDCRSLRHIELDSTAVTAEGLRTLLRRNPDLRRIEVRGTPVTPEEAAQLHQDYPNTEIVCERLLTAAELFGGR
jgi:hypothetical protein